MSVVFAHGGGRSPDPALWRRFVAATGVDAPRVAVVVLADDEPAAAFARWEPVLLAAGAGRCSQVVVGPADPLAVAHLDGADALFIAHGLTPGYAAVVAPHAAAVREVLLDREMPVGGSSAGAAVLSDQALVGGWRLHGRQVCAEEAGEDLEPVTVARGLGLLPFGVDVHAAQWGTLSRLVAAVDSGLLSAGVALDEETVLEVRGADRQVRGAGHVWCLPAAGAPLQVLTDGERLSPTVTR